MKTSGHDVLVTGGTRGIGLALARKFRSEGNRVLITGRDEGQLAALGPGGEGFETIAADLSDAGEREKLIAAVRERMPDISVLVNNAGMQCQGQIAGDLTMERIGREVEVNAIAPLHLIDGLLPELRKRDEAAVVNVSSTLVIQPKQSAPVYCATKAFLSSYTRALSYQLEGSTVRAFDILPPLVDTDMTAGRGTGKIPPERVAEEFWSAWRRDRYFVPVGKARILATINRLSPSLAQKLVRHG